MGTPSKAIVFTVIIALSLISFSAAEMEPLSESQLASFIATQGISAGSSESNVSASTIGKNASNLSITSILFPMHQDLSRYRIMPPKPLAPGGSQVTISCYSVYSPAPPALTLTDKIPIQTNQSTLPPAPTLPQFPSGGMTGVSAID
ncbi:hypothetical protein [Desulfoluna butyratoxydans]|uniref:Uncharacterized protein n=1 Tax=Desulfoluna butyratoxydans TaxID=231438 RepID=A0A4U8YMY4_9BACT|nr:hypothetical protein [Desulfoluna butyratoxydans]VFQ45101.1 hypothetical protein MSL71_27580 [Desulfoluna butyratoxydans]